MPEQPIRTVVPYADFGTALTLTIGVIMALYHRDRTGQGQHVEGAGLKPSDVALWEINEAFASVPIAACREHRIDEELVNFSGSGCILGHPIAASGARMVTTFVYELQRRGGGLGVAAMCAGDGQGGAVVIRSDPHHSPTCNHCDISADFSQWAHAR